MRVELKVFAEKQEEVASIIKMLESMNSAVVFEVEAPKPVEAPKAKPTPAPVVEAPVEKVEAPVEAPKPVAETVADEVAKVMTLEDCRVIAKELVALNKQKEVTEAVLATGAQKISQVKPENVADFYKALVALKG